LYFDRISWAVNESALAVPAEIANTAIAETEAHPSIDLIIVFPCLPLNRGAQIPPVASYENR
jgi:hypothetical protein